MDTNYIYALVDPNNPEVIMYIGRTNNPPRRLSEHTTDFRQIATNKKMQWIFGLIQEGRKPVMNILFSVEEDQVAAAEAVTIYKALQLGHPLTNAESEMLDFEPTLDAEMVVSYS